VSRSPLSIVRPPDAVGVGLMFYPGYTVNLLVSFCQLPLEVTERKSAKTCHMFGNKCNLKIHVNIWSPPKTWAPKLPIFDHFAMANLTANVFRTKQDKDNQRTALETLFLVT